MPGGWIALEVDSARAAVVAALAAGFGWIEPVVHQDLYGRARFVLARRSEIVVIWEKAKDLGRLIGQSTEYKALRRTEQALREDAPTVAKLDAIQQLAAKVDQMMAAGQMPDPETTAAYETAVRELEVSATGQAYAVARANFEKVMAKVNQEISEGMELGATSSIISL